MGRGYKKILNNLFLGLSCCGWWLMSFANPAVKVAVSANFSGTMQELQKEFIQHSQCRVKIISGSTTVLFSQITQGAKFDLFFAADRLHPELLVQQKLALSKSRKTYALGQLVFWAPGQNVINFKTSLQNNMNTRWVIANPKFAPYGVAAQSVLKKLNLFASIKKQLIFANNVGQAFLYVQQHVVNGGFVALSQLLEYAVTVPIKPSEVWVIPHNYYSPLVQQMVILKHGYKNNCAYDLYNFVSGSRARHILIDAGYHV